jgi:hypothetical protein
MHDTDADFDKTRIEQVERLIGSPVEPVTTADQLIGGWDMRFGGPVGSDKIRWSYEFKADGRVLVRTETWRWKFKGDGTLSFFVPIAPIPHIPGWRGGRSKRSRIGHSKREAHKSCSPTSTSVCYRF